MMISEQTIREIGMRSRSRIELWREFIQAANVQQMAEIGVYKGDFAAAILKECRAIDTYYLIDPWKHLENWNKPANEQDDVFEQFLLETQAKTEFAAAKRVILRGKTTEVIEAIPDNTLDFAYIDGDHTLKGIAIDLIRVSAKVKTGGWIGGDDLSPTIWQHRTMFEPTLVFPFAVYFAEAIGATIYALPYSQFLIKKKSDRPFQFIDLTGHYANLTLRDQLSPKHILKRQLSEQFPWLVRLDRTLKKFLS